MEGCGRLGNLTHVAAFDYAPGFMKREHVGDLLFQQLPRSVDLGGEQGGAEQAVELIEILRHFASMFEIEGGLEMSGDCQRVVKFVSAPNNVVTITGFEGASQVLQQLLVEQDHQPDWVAAPGFRLAICSADIHGYLVEVV